MNKKSIRIGVLLLLGAAVLFVIYDFVKDLNSEQQAREEASQQEVTIINDEESNTNNNSELAQSDESEDDNDFQYSEELEEDTNTDQETTNETESHVNSSPRLTYGAYPGEKVYDFELQEVGSEEIIKLSDFEGKKVFLNFWASWCPPCKVEAPHLQSFSESQDDVVVVGVNVTVSESNLENVQDFMDEYGFSFPNVYGVEEMFGLFYVESLPTSLFIDSNGIIQERVVGPVTEDILNAHFSMID